VYEGGNDRTKSPEPRWVFDVTPCEDGIKTKQLTLWEGESADLLFVAPWSLTPAKEGVMTDTLETAVLTLGPINAARPIDGFPAVL
jgi:hypothetical protein